MQSRENTNNNDNSMKSNTISNASRKPLTVDELFRQCDHYLNIGENRKLIEIFTQYYPKLSPEVPYLILYRYLRACIQIKDFENSIAASKILVIKNPGEHLNYANIAEIFLFDSRKRAESALRASRSH